MHYRLDIPKAPLLLGNLLGQAVSEKAADGAALQKLCKPIEDTEARRELISSILKFVEVIASMLAYNSLKWIAVYRLAGCTEQAVVTHNCMCLRCVG